MKTLITIFIIGAAIVLMSLQAAPLKENIGVGKAVDKISVQAKIFAQSTVTLENAIISLNLRDYRSVILARNALRNCRRNYKLIEYFLEYFFKSSAHIYNSPAKYEVEEPEIEYQEPIGFQVMETLLYQRVNADTKQELLAQAGAVKTSAQDINALLYNFQANDKQLLEGVRLELIRVMTLGITGYDAPFLKSGITESRYALQSIQSVLLPFLKSNSGNAQKITFLLAANITYLSHHPDFDHFDRLKFLTDYALPLQCQLNLLIRENHLELNTTGVLNYNAADLFSKKFFQVDSFYKERKASNAQMIALGKRLFFEKAISGNSLRSCASCHQPDKYFTDGLPKSTALDGHSTLKRNTPTLLYAAYQYSQDWDGRARSLEDQVINVMNNKDEMNADTTQVIQKMTNNRSYIGQFGKAFRGERSITIHNLSIAISAYLRTLSPLNSAFDRYIRGEINAMTASQIKGFNLFMGKARCGTCHFVPLFNGLTPPGYQVSEYEILGVPLNDDLQKPKYDRDSGRYTIYPTKYYNGAFKTPTVRNAARTGPYMHNGRFHSLQKVLDFYNKGGGNGIGLNIPEQTLSPIALKLTKSELNAIKYFISALTDDKKSFN